MKKINFTCPHCGEHTLIAEQSAAQNRGGKKG